MSVSGLLENLAGEHLAAYRGDIEQWRKNLTACYRAWSIPDVCTVPCIPASMWKMRGGFFCGGEQGYVSGFPKTLAPRARRLLGGANPLPPVADFGMKEVRTKKKNI